MPKLKYHQAVFDMLQREPVFSEANIAALNAQEKKLGITFPASVREWYSLEGANEILENYSNQDYPLEISALGVGHYTLQTLVLNETEQFPLCTFLVENQGCFGVAFSLDNSDDPPAYGKGGSFHPGQVGWELWSSHFSVYLYLWIWDFLYARKCSAIVAESESLLSADLAFLRSQFHEITPSNIKEWEPKSYRFERPEQHLKICNDVCDDNRITWFMEAATPKTLRDLVVTVGQCESFVNDHYQSFQDQVLDYGDVEKMLQELQSQ